MPEASSSRPRRSTRRDAIPSPPPAPGPSDDTDPEFLALPERQRRAIDRAFDRGVRSRPTGSGRASKRRRLGGAKGESSSRGIEDTDAGGDGGGGFVDEGDGWGFVVDDEDGGGFVPDDEGGFVVDDDEDAGGFVPDDDDGDDVKGHVEGESEEPSRVPLYLLPKLLASLGLPSDEDVLAVFRASASGWAGDDTERPEGEDDEMGVERKDFRAVCAALIPPDGEGEGEEEGDGEGDFEGGFEVGREGGGGGGGFVDDGTDDVFSKDDDEDDNDVYTDDDDDFAGPSKPSRSKSGKSTPAAKGKAKGRDAEIRPKLSASQRDVAKDIWKMLKDSAAAQMGSRAGAKGKAPVGMGAGTGTGGLISHDEVKTLARSMGEMWSEDEIADMVILFSSQHEGRGLSFDDFEAVALRSGLV